MATASLSERVDKLNDLIENVRLKQESLKAAVEKMETLQHAINFLNKEVEGKEIPVSTTEYGYQDLMGDWICNELPVSKEGFVEFLKKQKEEYCAAAEKLADELGETINDRRNIEEGHKTF